MQLVFHDRSKSLVIFCWFLFSVLLPREPGPGAEGDEAAGSRQSRRPSWKGDPFRCVLFPKNWGPMSTGTR